MDRLIMRKHLLENVNKMISWISEEFKKADCDVPFDYKFSVGFIYGHNCDYLMFRCHKETTFVFSHYGSQEVLRNEKLYNGNSEYTKSYLNNPYWYIPRENEQGFEKAMEEWPRVKEAVKQHLQKIGNLTSFEI